MWNLFSLSSSSLNCCSCRCMSLKLLIDHPRKKCRSGADRAAGTSKLLDGPTLYCGYNLSSPLIRIGLANLPRYGEDRSSRPHTFRRPWLSGAKTMPHGAISSVDVLFCNSKSRCIFMSKHLWWKALTLSHSGKQLFLGNSTIELCGNWFDFFLCFYCVWTLF